MHLKQAILNYNIDINPVCVDAKEVKERLLEDDKYGIDRIPAVLLIYSTGLHKTYMDKDLDAWFQQLIYNIQEYAQAAAAQPEESPQATLIQEDDNVPKPLKRRSRVSKDMRTTLPSPGSKLSESGPGTLGGNIPVSAMPISSSETTPLDIGGRREIKSDAVSPAERAKQMAALREEMDEELEQNKPFR